MIHSLLRLWARCRLFLIFLLLPVSVLLAPPALARSNDADFIPFPVQAGCSGGNRHCDAEWLGPFGDHSYRAAPQFGPAVSLGNGKIRSYVTVKYPGRPVEIGVLFSGAALTGLPDMSQPPSDGLWDVIDENGNVVWYCCGYEHVLELPQAAALTPFKHVVVNWNNHGHPPPAIYDRPHFDFHFYTISNATRTSIAAPAAEDMCGPQTPLSCEDADTALTPLPDEQMPPDYFSPGAVEPGMGNHMLDSTAVELAGEPFSQTWIYGTWDGAISFFEPMITLEYLQALSGEQCFDLKMPAYFDMAGYYPTRYCTYYHELFDVYRVELNRFRWFQGW